MRYRRVVDLHHMLGGDSNRSTVQGVEAPEDGSDLHDHVCAESVRVCEEELGASEVDCVDYGGCYDHYCWSSLHYRRYKGVPDDFLVLLDNKIDEAADKFDKHAPPLAKQTVHLALGSIHKALEKIQAFVNKAQTRGLHTAAIHDAATGNNQFLFNQPIKFWVGLECQCPPIHTVAKKATPAAVYLSQKYNQVVRDLTMKGYTVFGYPPLVPLDAISTALSMARQRR
ncbi:hypothetical protein ACLB2K_034447 [Fragaria x ananassa]